MRERPIIICLTPVKNEAWILDTFLQCTSLWADYIIIADQQSTDGSREIALKYPKVILIDNPIKEYNEVERQKILLSEARKINGKKLLITLDADEFFTSNYEKTSEWDKMLQGEPGEIFGFQWINLLPGFKKCWTSDGYFPWAMIDNGFEHEGDFIHNPRLPIKNYNSIINLKEIKVLHYQYTNWERMESKHRYYQCIERIKFPNKHSIDIFRTYHHMYNIPDKKIEIINEGWFSGYLNLGINIKFNSHEKNFWYDDEVTKLFDQYKTEKFKREAIWTDLISKYDNRSRIDKIIHYYLLKTKSCQNSLIIKNVDKLLKKIY